MRKGLLFFLCLLLFAAVLFGCAAYLRLAPRGVLNDTGPEETLQNMLETTSEAAWAELLRPLWPQAVTEFEDRDALFDALFERAAAGRDFRFRELEGSASALSGTYILSAGETDLALVTLVWENGVWRPSRWEMPEGLLSAEARTLSLTVPEGAELRVNGVAVSEAYLADDNVPYEDMTALERRFDAVPHALRYEIPGILGEVTTEAAGQTLLYAGGSAWRFAPPDAAAYSFRVLAPAEAEVTVNGAALTDAECTERRSLSVDVDVPAEYAAAMPAVCLYEAAGLYSAPTITVTLNGAALEGREEDGAWVYERPENTALAEELTPLVREFLEAYCRYGAHHFGYGSVVKYVVPDTDLYRFIVNSQASLIWINGEQVNFHGITAGDFLALGDGCCLCSAHVSCTTVTYYETQELEMDYQLLLLHTGDGWLVGDMAYE